MNIMTFNMRSDWDGDGKNAWRYRSDAAANIIKKATIVGTQEGESHMIEDLESELDSYSWIGEDRDGTGNSEYCAIFYDTNQVSLLKTDTFWLSETPLIKGSIGWDGKFPRICTWAHFKLIENETKEFIVYNTHLDHIGGLARENGIKKIIDKVIFDKTKSNIPSIIMGDFNSYPNSNVINCLESNIEFRNDDCHFKSAYLDRISFLGCTRHDFLGGINGEPIDYIFCTKEIELKNTEIIREKFNGKYPSDHYPVITEMIL